MKYKKRKKKKEKKRSKARSRKKRSASHDQSAYRNSTIRTYIVDAKSWPEYKGCVGMHSIEHL